jgi:hypothetical protein
VACAADEEALIAEVWILAIVHRKDVCERAARRSLI